MTKISMKFINKYGQRIGRCSKMESCQFCYKHRVSKKDKRITACRERNRLRKEMEL